MTEVVSFFAGHGPMQDNCRRKAGDVSLASDGCSSRIWFSGECMAVSRSQNNLLSAGRTHSPNYYYYYYSVSVSLNSNGKLPDKEAFSKRTSCERHKLILHVLQKYNFISRFCCCCHPILNTDYHTGGCITFLLYLDAPTADLNKGTTPPK